MPVVHPVRAGCEKLLGGIPPRRYKPSGWLGLRRARFGYIGATDSHGRPHGDGLWYDTSFHGECLSGKWEHGEPRTCDAKLSIGTSV